MSRQGNARRNGVLSAAMLGLGAALALFSAPARAQPAYDLTGQVSSAQEGPMEGVVVSARQTGSTITVSVASDEKGIYRFPAGRLRDGRYDLTIRATGYD